MMKTLNYLRRPIMFCLALLACVFALSGAPVRAADTQTLMAPSLPANTIPADIFESGRSCLWGGRVVQGCIVVDNPDEYTEPEIDAVSVTEVDSPLAETAAAIVVEVTQSTTIAAPGEITEIQAPIIAALDLPTAVTGLAIPVEITQSITIAVPGDVTEEQHVDPRSGAGETYPFTPQTDAAIILQITQSVTIAVPGQPPEADQQVSVAALPEHEEE